MKAIVKFQENHKVDFLLEDRAKDLFVMAENGGVVYQTHAPWRGWTVDSIRRITEAIFELKPILHEYPDPLPLDVLVGDVLVGEIQFKPHRQEVDYAERAAAY